MLRLRALALAGGPAELVIIDGQRACERPHFGKVAEVERRAPGAGRERASG
jgi:hypothetical protein